jgi:flavin-dependent dehydrogenase
MDTSYDAIIIGAGPAGSSAAILLARAGWSVALLERAPFPRRKVCGECIAAGNLPLLEALGLGAALRQHAGPPLRRVALWHGEESVSAALPACPEGGHPWGRALAREHLDTLLLEQARAAGAVVLQPCRALAMRGAAQGTGSHVEAAAGRHMSITLRAPVLIRAHGSWQPPPAAPTERFGRERRPADLLAFKASFRDTALADGLLPVLAFDGGYGGMVVAGDGLATLACCIRRDRLAASRRAGAPGAGEAVETLLRRECRGVRDALSGATRMGPWLAAGPIRPGVRLGRARDEGFLIGNAAGEVHPLIGEGISMALQSAWLLCEELGGCAEALRSDVRGEMCRRRIRQRYARRWRAQFLGRMRIAACLAQTAMHPDLAAPLLALLRRAPRLLGIAARLSGKTRCAVSPATTAPAAGRQAGISAPEIR